MLKSRTLFALRLALLLVVSLSVLVSPASRAGGAGGFIVVVNAANSTGALTADEVSKMFFKKTSHWSDGEKVLPVDLGEQSPVRESFSAQIHGRATAAVKAYWQKMIFSGRDVPPLEKPSSDDVLAYVRANPGAIGYVAAGTALGSGVRALAVR